jgi:hypothetical protein
MPTIYKINGHCSLEAVYLFWAMQVNELVNVVRVFPGVSSLGAFGCDSGRIGVFDSEMCRITYSSNLPRSVMSMAIDENNILYAADSQRVFRHDMRTNDSPRIQFQTLSEISDVAVYGPSICAATQRHGISISDGRQLQRMLSETEVNPVPPNICYFSGTDRVICCYEDAKIVSWNFKTEDWTDFEVPQILTARKLLPQAMTAFYKSKDKAVIIAVVYESGVSIYSDGAFLEHCSFGQKGRFGTMSHAPCFGDDYVIAVVDGCSLLPCQIGGEAAKSMDFHGAADICSVSANHLMICIAEGDDEGYLAVIMPESFGDEFY